MISCGDVSRYPNGIFTSHIISPDVTKLTGKVYYACNASQTLLPPGVKLGVDTGASNGSYNKPFASLDYAVGKCLAGRNDLIRLMPGHNESVIEAAGLALDVADITVEFLGEGQNQAKVTFSTDVDADMDIDADSVTLINPKFVAAIDALTGPIDVNAADFKVINGKYYDATDIDTTDCIVADANATRLHINGWRYFKGNEGGTQKESHIQLNGVDDAILENIDIWGDFGTGNIENVTDEVLNIRFKNLSLNNTNSGPIPGIVLDSNADGFAENVKIRVASGTTYVSDLADINWGADCLGFNTDGAGGEPIGTAVATGVEGKIDVIDAFHDVATADAVTNTVMSDVIGNKTDAAVTAVGATKSLVAYAKGLLGGLFPTDGSFIPGLGYQVTKSCDLSGANDDLFTITGKVMVTMITGQVEGGALTGAESFQLRLKTSNEPLCAATTIDTDADGTMYLLTGDVGAVMNAGDAPTTNVAQAAGTALTPLIIGQAGGSATIESNTTGNGGTIDFILYYMPLEASAAVVAAA